MTFDIALLLATLVGAVIMVLGGFLTMDEAYRNAKGRAVFLIAGLLPMGVAREKTGALQGRFTADPGLSAGRTARFPILWSPVP